MGNKEKHFVVLFIYLFYFFISGEKIERQQRSLWFLERKWQRKGK